MTTEMGPGTTFAGFRIEDTVSVQAEAVVYRAVDAQLGRVVALKVLSASSSDDAEDGSGPSGERFRDRFVDEARVVSAIDHPNVIPIYSFGEQDGLLYMAMRYVSHGTSLRALLTDATGLSADDSINLMTQAARAVDAVHRAGVIHGDVTPENLLLSERGNQGTRHLYLTNFGLTGGEPGEAGGAQQTSSASPGYASPERKQHLAVDGRSDIYSLGCILFEMLAGRPAFGEEESGGHGRAERHGSAHDPASLHQLRPELPSSIDAVIAKAVSNDPDDRYQTGIALMDAATDALTGVLDSGGGRGRAMGGAGTPGVRSPGDGVETFVAGAPPLRVRGGEEQAVPQDESADGRTVVADSPPPRVRSKEPARRDDDPATVVAAGAPARLLAADDGGPTGTPMVDDAAATAMSAGPPPRLRSDGDPAVPGDPGRQGVGGANGQPPPSSKKALLALLAVLVVVALVAAGLFVRQRDEATAPAAAPSTSATPSPGGTIRLGVPSRPAAWNPTRDLFTPTDLFIARGIYDPLMVTRNGVPEPFLAESLTPNADHTRWTLRVRSGVTFHDGTPLNARAVQQSLGAAAEQPPLNAWLQPIDDMRVDDDRTLTISTRIPWPSFPATLSSQVGLVVAPSMVGGAGPRAVGTGPFKLASDRDPRVVSLKKNASYWRPNEPMLDQIQFEVVPAASGRSDQLLASELDVAIMPSNDTSRLVGGFASRSLGRVVVAIALNTGRPVAAELDRRRGMAMALDRQALASGATVVNSPFVDPPWAIPGPAALDHDADRAKALLSGSSRLELIVSTANEPLAKSIKDQWAAFGVTAELSVVDTTSRLTSGQYDAALVELPVVGDPDIDYPLLHTVADQASPSTLNFSRSTRTETDSALQTGRESADRAARTSAYTEVVAALDEQVVGYLWLFAQEVSLVSVDQDFNLNAINDDLASPLATIGVQR